MKKNKCTVYGRAFPPLVLLFYIVWVTEVAASSQVDSKALNSAPTMVGQARMNYLWWNIYDIQLFAETSIWSPSRVYALKLNYLVDIEGRKIAERTILEIEQLGLTDEATLSQWLQMLTEVFPDVRKGDSLTGVYMHDKTTLFYKNDTLLYAVKDPLFGEFFFGIWLSERTSEPKIRKQLLGADFADRRVAGNPVENIDGVNIFISNNRKQVAEENP